MLNSVEEYSRVVARIKSLMRTDKSEAEKLELASLLDKVDLFDGLKFLKVPELQEN